MSLICDESLESDAIDVDLCQIPPKSREKYMQAYYNFVEWKKKKKAKSFKESVFLKYFKELAKDRLPSTLWSTYSMLRPTVSLKNNINIKTFKKLSAYLKKMAKGHKSRKSNVLTKEEVDTFLNDAPDEDYLLTKVVLIVGIEGACRGNELLKITIDDIENKSDHLFVKMTDTKTNKDKSFTIRAEYKHIVEKYLALRPDRMKTKRFFIRYRNGKCMRQVIGKNRFSVVAQEIASYLKLSDALFYTGHCFRRTSAILLPKPAADQSEAEGQKADTSAEQNAEEKTKDSMGKDEEIASCAEVDIKTEPPEDPPSPPSPIPSPLPTTALVEIITSVVKEEVPDQPDSDMSDTQDKNQTTSDPNKNATETVIFYF